MSRALVISGGGSKGAFAVGVIKRLQREYPGLEFDIFVGTSTGSLIVPLVALGEMALVEKLYTTQKTEDIVITNRLGDRINDNSIFDAGPLEELVIGNYTDQRYSTLLVSGKKIFLNTVCLQTGNLVVFTNATDPAVGKYYEVKTLADADHFRRAVMASASQPVFMPPVKVNKNVPGEAHPDHQFVDGGVREYAGVEMAIDNGATEIFTILLSSDQADDDDGTITGLFTILQKTVDIFIDDVGKNDLIIPEQYNEALEYIDAIKNKMKRAGISADKITEYFNVRGRQSPYEDKVPLKLYTIRPDAPLGGGPGGLTFDPVAMQAMLKKGETAGDDFIASLKPADITWA